MNTKIEIATGWQSQLTPGVLYVTFVTEQDADGNDYARDGSFVYWTGSELVYEDGEVYDGDIDWLVRQSSDPNPEFVWN